MANHVIKRFFLPQRSAASQQLIHSPGRCAFDSSQYVDQTENISISISHGGQQEMNVFWHNNCRMKVKPHSISEQTATQDLVAAGVRQRCSQPSSKSCENRSVGFLEMRKPPAVFELTGKH
jgi:hypothetical protein